MYKHPKLPGDHGYEVYFTTKMFNPPHFFEDTQNRVIFHPKIPAAVNFLFRRISG